MSLDAPVQIGSYRHLFVDAFWIAESTGVERRLHQPVRREAAIFTEHPWETGITAYNTVALDQGRFKIWYATDDQYIDNPMLHGYAESTDGFVSVNAGFAGGEFLTKPLVLKGGELELNYSTSAVGSVRVEIQDAHNRALPGYGLDECPEIFGDQIEGVARWSGGTDLSSLAGQSVRLRFALKDADIYAFRFR